MDVDLTINQARNGVPIKTLVPFYFLPKNCGVLQAANCCEFHNKIHTDLRLSQASTMFVAQTGICS